MNEDALSQLYLKDTAFQDLMQKRIFNVLLIASTYDAFMMEEDGRVEEQLYFEYISLNLSSPPRVTRVLNSAEAIGSHGLQEFRPRDNDAGQRHYRDILGSKAHQRPSSRAAYHRAHAILQGGVAPSVQRGFHRHRLRVLMAWQRRSATRHHQVARGQAQCRQ